MQQLPSQPHPQTPSNPSKIKPLLRIYSRENQLTEENSQISLKLHLKPFRTSRADTHQTRGSFPRYIEGYQRVLAPQDSLSRLSYTFDDEVFFENAYIFSKIRNSSNLTSLDVKFFTDQVHSVPLEILFKSLTYLKDLTHFKMEFHYHHFTDASLLPELFHSLQRLKKLKHLSLSFQMCYNFEKVRIHHLPKYLIRLKQLQSLELNLDRPTDLQDRHIINLASALSKLPLLTQINLSLGQYGRMIPPSPFLQIFNNIRTLRDINLSLRGFYVLNQGATGFLAEGVGQLDAPSVQKLRLHVHQNPEPQDFTRLCQTFTRFTSLNLLHLSLYDCSGLTRDSIAELCSAVSHLTTLSSFGLKLLYIAKPTSVIGCIASAIKSLPHLVHFQLHFGRDMESHPDEIPQLSASLATLASLRFLDVSFAHQKSLSNEVLEKFSKSLQKLTQLKHLTFDFENAPMTTQGVEFLTNAIAKMQGLSALDLNFGNIQEINEEAIEKIAQALRNLPSLYSFNIRFFNCVKLRENKSLLSLFNALKEMRNIREVRLKIPQNNINELEVDDLQKIKMLSAFWLS